MFFPDSGSEFFPSQIWIFSIPDPIFSVPDPGSASENLSIWSQKIVYKLSEISSGLFIPNPDTDFFTLPGSRIQGSKRHRIPDPDPQQSFFGYPRFLQENTRKNFSISRVKVKGCLSAVTVVQWFPELSLKSYYSTRLKWVGILPYQPCSCTGISVSNKKLPSGFGSGLFRLPKHCLLRNIFTLFTN